jgi:membrane-associated phospholipid phosphatase
MTLPRLVFVAALAVWPLQPIDDAIHHWVVAHPHAGTRATMEGVTKYSRYVLFGAAAAGLVAGPVGRAFVGELVVALVPVNLAVEGLKWTVWRTRPDGDRSRRNSSFPSSHAANAFALAAVLTRRWKVAAIPAWLLAAIVGAARILLDRHWLSDVLGSLALGLGGAWLAAWLLAKWRARRAAAGTS